MPDRGGSIVSAKTVHRRVAHVLNRHAGALAEKALRRALEGDGHALLACATLLALGLSAAPEKEPKK